MTDQELDELVHLANVITSHEETFATVRKMAEVITSFRLKYAATFRAGQEATSLAEKAMDETEAAEAWGEGMMNRLTAQIEKLEADVDTLRSGLEATANHRAKVEGECDELRAKVAALEDSIKTSNAEAQWLIEQRDKDEARIAALERERDALRKTVLEIAPTLPGARIEHLGERAIAAPTDKGEA